MSLIDSLNFVQSVSSPTLKRGHTLDLVLTRGFSVHTVSVKYLMLAFLIITLWCLNLTLPVVLL